MKRIPLYKFMPAEYAMQSLEKGRVKVSTIDDLNDPFDCHPVFVAKEPVYEAKAQRYRDNWRTVMAKTVGLVCCSGTFSETLLWSHYADSHRGIAFEVSNFVTAPLIDVDYPKKRSQIVVDDLEEDNPDAADLVVSKIFGQKAESWTYEDEYRLYYPLDMCAIADGRYFLNISKDDFLKRVILGVNCTVSSDLVSRALRQNGFLDVEVVQARLSHTDYRIEV